MTFVAPARSFNAIGQLAANSMTAVSRNGERASRPCAMLTPVGLGEEIVEQVGAEVEIENTAPAA